MLKELYGIHKAIFALSPLSGEEWDDFAGHLRLKEVRRGEFLTREGTIEHYLYFLNRGATRHFYLKDGKEFTVDFHFAGEFVTAYYSFITRQPSAVSIEVLEDAEVVVISHKELQDFYATSHSAEKIGRLMAERQYVLRLRKEMDLLSYSAEERYAQLMEKHPEMVQLISVKHLSSYLGIQPESLSRIRKLHLRN
jgi:CRP-like cAMP-binding protein